MTDLLEAFSEKRHSRRYETEDVFGTVQCKFGLTVLNINDHGVCIETGKRLELGRVYGFKICVNGSSLNVKGYPVWSFLTQRRENGYLIPVYRTGVEFICATNNPIDIEQYLEVTYYY